MLTADPEAFPLGLAELGLKKPKAGGENTRVTTETESSPAQWPWLGPADLPTEENKDLRQPERRRGESGGHCQPWYLQRSSRRCT